MVLLHKLKSGSHKIPLDAQAALQDEAFATYTETKAGKVSPIAVGWRWLSQHDGKYAGHQFELIISPEEIDRAIHALTVAKERFAAEGE